jgi:hypothetical protein
MSGTRVSVATEFKKGVVPHNVVPIGTIRIHEAHGETRRFIKTPPKKWIEYARWVWSQANGSIPRGCVIHHKDGDKLNDNPENLECMTRNAHMALHDPRGHRSK